MEEHVLALPGLISRTPLNGYPAVESVVGTEIIFALRHRNNSCCLQFIFICHYQPGGGHL